MTDLAHFDRLYRANPDPWNYESSPYERRKYAATLAALGRQRFVRGLEIGCSIGVLSEGLARRCDQLVALDAAEGAIARARERASERARGKSAERATVPGAPRRTAHAEFRCATVPDGLPGGRFDLVVMSEVLYYLDAIDLARLARRLRVIAPGALAVMVNYTGPTGSAASGRVARARFLRASGAARRLTRSPAAPYMLDVLRLPG